MTTIHAQAERKRQDRSVCRAEKRLCRARMLRVRGLIHPTSAVCATTDTARGEKRLPSEQNQAILKSSGRPLGECRLKGVNSEARFISFEPLLGRIEDVDLRGIAWAIVGGESGPGARPMQADWARRLRDICDRDDVAFFFKQWGGARPKSGGRLLDGEEWNGFPWQIVPKPILDALQPESV